MELTIDLGKSEPLSERLFGHNLEHTRAAVIGGLSAQMIRNRKFAGKPSLDGVSAEWEGVGDRPFFLTEGESYTRHICCEGMPRRNELQSLRVQNLRGGVCGIRQKGLYIKGGAAYELRVVVRCFTPIRLTAALTGGDGETVYAQASFDVIPGDWQILRASLTQKETDEAACIRFTFTEQTQVAFGAVSLLPADHFHGMRRDVVACLKQIAPAVIRWPGGNFAGEYRWKDGLLPCDMRGPLESLMEDESQTFSHGYDFHEVSTDEFIALCREVGAEPFVTINPVWCTPEESAQWVEYCNGSADTEYGAKRAENGNPEPYRIRLWSLGNEKGYGHMEGPKTAADYAAMARAHADAMLAADPEIELSSSGPYPNDEWARESAAALTPVAKYVSLHHYAFAQMDYTPDRIESSYASVVGSAQGALDLAVRMRESIDRFAPGLRISFDEWNLWYSWFRPSCVTEGVFTAKMLHMFINKAAELGVSLSTYFQPINEGAIEVTPKGARLSADGQVFALAKGHRGGRRCPVYGADEFTAAATEKGGTVTVTLVNESFDQHRDFVLNGLSGEARGVLCGSDEIVPCSYFQQTALPVKKHGAGFVVTLPPHSVAAVTVRPEP